MKDKEKVTLTLPTDLMNQVRVMAPARGYSQFISRAVEFYIEAMRQQSLEAALADGYQANAEHDRGLSDEWRAVETEIWQNLESRTI